MKLFMLQLVTTITLLVSCLAINEDILSDFKVLLASANLAEEECPPCEVLFRNLKPTGSEGKLSQITKVQERGEPKSGTGLMYDWASGTVMWTCRYLQLLFGEHSCRLVFAGEDQHEGRAANRTMIFEPALGGSDSRCSCDTVERVTIVLSRSDKHTLPVQGICAYSHKFGIQLAPELDAKQPGVFACNLADGTHVQSYDDLLRCVHEASCEVVDEWLQMAVFRDPRPAVVSAFFHLQLYNGLDLGTLGEFVARELPILCQWLTIRYILFTEIIPHQSVEFWYADAIADPLSWHYHWLEAVGLQLPFNVIEATAKAAAANRFGFRHKNIDVHPGEGARHDAGARQFHEEVSPEVVATAAIVLRTWLPPVLLERFGVAP